VRNEPGIGKLALEARIPFLDQRRADPRARNRGQPELGELVDVAARPVADPDPFGAAIDGRNVDYAFATVA